MAFGSLILAEVVSRPRLTNIDFKLNSEGFGRKVRLILRKLPPE